MATPEGPQEHEPPHIVPSGELSEQSEEDELDIADIFQKMWPGTVVRRRGNETEIILPPEEDNGDEESSEPTQP